MIFQLETTSAVTVAGPDESEALINDWASRVMDMWEDSRSTPGAVSAGDSQMSGELAEACQIRDSLNNQLERTHSDSAECVERSLRLLESADELFRNFTVECTTASALSVHNHYPHLREWWWRRLPRQRTEFAAA